MTIIEHISTETIDDAKLNQLELDVRNKLPVCYRMFLKKHNGGRPKPSTFQFTSKEGKKENSIIQYFFAVYNGRIGNLRKKFEIYNGRIPENYLPIATDPFGNLLLIPMLDQADVPIFFWDHELESEGGASFDNVSLIANSFDNFINGLQ